MGLREEIFEDRPRRKSIISKRALAKMIIVTVILIAVAFFAVFLYRNLHYEEYKVVLSKESSDTSARYEEFNGRMLSYSPNGVSLLNEKLESIWNYPFSYSSPEIEITGDNFIAFDKGSTGVSLFNENGNTGSFTAPAAIIRAKSSDNDCAALLMYDGNEFSAGYYDCSGNLLAKADISFEEQGVPSDVEISADGKCMAVSLESVAESGIETKIMFCRFGNSENEEIYYSETYQDSVTAGLISGENNNFAALTDTGFNVYGSGKELKLIRRVEVEAPVLSAFYNEKYIGFVVQNNNDESFYKILLYNYTGRKVSEIDFGLNYSDISINDKSIVIFNKTEYEMYSINGIKRLQGTISEGSVNNIFRVRKNKYFVSADNLIEFIRGSGLTL